MQGMEVVTMEDLVEELEETVAKVVETTLGVGMMVRKRRGRKGKRLKRKKRRSGKRMKRRTGKRKRMKMPQKQQQRRLVIPG